MERMLSIDEQNYHYSSSSQINIRKAVPRFLQIYAGIIPWVFLLGIIAAELAVGFWSVSIGMALHVILLIALLAMAVICWYYWDESSVENSHSRAVGQPVVSATDQKEQSANARMWALYSYRLYLGLTLAPLIRILSLSIPLGNIDPQYFFLIPGIPLLAAAFTAARLAGYRMSDIYLAVRNRKNGHNWKVQFAVLFLGIPLGFMEYAILRPDPIIPVLTVGSVVTASFILIIFTGLTEEMIFRGILKRSADDFLGEGVSIIYVSLLFAALHITHLSALDVLFVFGVALLFSVIVHRTESLYGVVIAHGLTNINLFILGPHLFG